MKPLRFVLAMTAALLVFQVCSSNAKAQCWGGFGFPGYGYGAGFGYGYGYARYTPQPYFAVFPPVYYGQRLTMPYGDRPFANDWGYQFGRYRQASQVPRAAAAPSSDAGPSDMIVNPYLQGGGETSTSGNFASIPKVIENPYVNQELSTRPGVLVKVQPVR